MRESNKPICGRDHLSYRSTFYPVKHIVDGDLCELYLESTSDIRKNISTQLDRSVADIDRKVLDMREKIL